MKRRFSTLAPFALGVLVLTSALTSPSQAAVTEIIQQGSTSMPIPFTLVSTADGQTPLNGLTPTVYLSKTVSGALTAAVVPSGTVSQPDSTNEPGVYQIAGNSTDTSNLGLVHVTVTATGAVQRDFDVLIVAYNGLDGTGLGLSQVAKIGLNTGDSPNAVTAQGNVATVVSQTSSAAEQAADANALTAAGYTSSLASNLATTNTTVAGLPSASTIASSVWGTATRTLTAFSFLPSDYLSSGEQSKLTSASTSQQAGSAVTLGTVDETNLTAAASQTTAANQQANAYAALNQAAPGSPTAGSLFAQEAADQTNSAAASTILNNLITGSGASTKFTTVALSNAPGTSGNVTVGGYATGQDPGTLTWAAGTRTLTGGVTVTTNNDKGGYSLAASQTFSTTGSVGSVTGSVGSISGITFPSNFGTFSINSSGQVTLVPGQSTVASNFVAAPTLSQITGSLPTDATIQADAYNALNLAIPGSPVANSLFGLEMADSSASNSSSTFLSNLVTGTGAGTKFTTVALSNSPAGSSAPTLSQITGALLSTPGTPINNDSSGRLLLQPAQAYANSTQGTVQPSWYTPPPTISQIASAIFAFTLAGTTFGDHVINNSAVTWGNGSVTYGSNSQATVYSLGSTPYITSNITTNTSGKITTKSVTPSNQ